MVAPRYEATARRLRARAQATQCVVARWHAGTRRRDDPRRVRRAARTCGSELVRASPAPPRAPRTGGRARRRNWPAPCPNGERARRRLVDAAYQCARPTWPLSPNDDIDFVLARGARAQAARRDRPRHDTRRAHRDEWRLRLGGLESRTHASARGAAHARAVRLGGTSCTEITGTARAAARRRLQRARRDAVGAALTAHLTAGPTLVTTAGRVPEGVHADRVFHVDAGRVAAAPCRTGSARDAMTRPHRSSDHDPVPIGDALAAVRAGARDAARRRDRRARSNGGRRSSATTSRRTRGSSECATVCSRSPSTALRGRRDCGTSKGSCSSARTRSSGAIRCMRSRYRVRRRVARNRRGNRRISRVGLVHWSDPRKGL